MKLVQSGAPTSKLVYPTISVALDFVAIALDAIAWAAPHFLALAITAAVVSAVAAAIAYMTPDVPGFETASQISEIISFAALGPTGYDVAKDLNQL